MEQIEGNTCSHIVWELMPQKIISDYGLDEGTSS